MSYIRQVRRHRQTLSLRKVLGVQHHQPHQGDQVLPSHHGHHAVPLYHLGQRDQEVHQYPRKNRYMSRSFKCNVKHCKNVCFMLICYKLLNMHYWEGTTGTTTLRKMTVFVMK